MAYDQIIRNCRIINGCGTPWFTADLAIKGDRIAAIGSLDHCKASIEIDGGGSYLAPGINLLSQMTNFYKSFINI